MNVQTAARIALGTLAVAEGASALNRFENRKRLFAIAAQRAQQTGRRLVVVGDPDAGMHTRLLRAYGCGDVCIDLVGCSACPDSITADITTGPVPGIKTNSAVVYVACVLEYVSDPRKAWTEIVRMAGSTENVFIVPVQAWTVTSTLYPGAQWAILQAPPTSQSIAVRPVSNERKAVYALGIATLIAMAVWP